MTDKKDEVLKKLEGIDKRLKVLENDFYNLDDYLPNHSLINKSIQFIEKKGKVSRDEFKKRFSISDFRAIQLFKLLTEQGFLKKEGEKDEERSVNPEAFYEYVEPVISYSKEDLFKRAVEIVKGQEKVSTALLQRSLSIGYASAARILDQMEAKGILGPAEGSKPRDVLKNKDK